jgi:hypothetical protein
VLEDNKKWDIVVKARYSSEPSAMRSASDLDNALSRRSRMLTHSSRAIENTRGDTRVDSR